MKHNSDIEILDLASKEFAELEDGTVVGPFEGPVPTMIDPPPIDAAEETKKEKKLRHSLDAYIIFSFTCVILYTIVSFVFTYCTGITLDTLTTCVFATFGGEILCCAVIKRFKLKEENGGDKG